MTALGSDRSWNPQQNLFVFYAAAIVEEKLFHLITNPTIFSDAQQAFCIKCNIPVVNLPTQHSSFAPEFILNNSKCENLVILFYFNVH